MDWFLYDRDLRHDSSNSILVEEVNNIFLFLSLLTTTI